MAIKIKVAFFCPNLGGGGAEMHLARLIQNLNKDIFEITLILARKGGQYEPLIPKEVTIIHLRDGRINKGILGYLLTILPLSKTLKKIDPHLFVSIMDQVNLIAFLAFKKAKIASKLIFCIQTPILQGLKYDPQLFNKMVSLLIPKVYPKADMIIALSEGVRQDLIKLNPKISSNSIVINNIGADQEDVARISDTRTDNRSKEIMMVCGRLIALKGFDDAIKALALIREIRDIELWIIGEGNEKEKLSKLANQLNVQDHVIFHGFKSNPQEYMKMADVFLLSSHYEGFGNVIIESMAVGTPVVATDCPFGPGEIITDQENGLLVPVANHKAMAKSIVQILDNPELKRKLVLNAINRSEDFSGIKISNEYENAFISLIKQ